MQTFRDNAGRTWTVAINVTAVKRVRARLGLDLYRLIEDRFRPLSELLSDPVRLADVLYVLCQDEAAVRGVTDEDFGRALAGDAISLGGEAFLAALVDFFPDARARDGLTKVLAASRKVRDRVLEHAATLAERIDPDREATALIASLGSVRGSSESTPAHSPSAS